VKVNFVYQLDQATEYPDIWLDIIQGVYGWYVSSWEKASESLDGAKQFALPNVVSGAHPIFQMSD
jgi:hypothetical protein